MTLNVLKLKTGLMNPSPCLRCSGQSRLSELSGTENPPRSLYFIAIKNKGFVSFSLIWNSGREDLASVIYRHMQANGVKLWLVRAVRCDGTWHLPLVDGLQEFSWPFIFSSVSPVAAVGYAFIHPTWLWNELIRAWLKCKRTTAASLCRG